MKLLLLVFRSTFESAVLRILDSLKLPGYTEAPQVYGTGAMGPVFDSHAWPGFNGMVLSALSEEDARRVVDALAHFAQTREKDGEHMPIRIFSVPCEQLL
jgi:hypothetical protein